MGEKRDKGDKGDPGSSVPIVAPEELPKRLMRIR